MSRLRVIYGLLIVVCVSYHSAYAQVHSQDVLFKVFVTNCDDGVPLDGIVFGKKGGSWVSQSTHDGMTKIKVAIVKAKSSASRSHVELFLLTNVPANQGWKMLDNGRVPICDYKDPEDYSHVPLKSKRNYLLSQIPHMEIQMLDRFTKYEEEEVKSGLTLGQVLYVNGDYVGAVWTLSNALKQHPDNHFILHNLAKALTKTGRYAEAQVAFDKCVNIREDPRRATPDELVDTLESYAALLLRMGKKVDAEKMQGRIATVLRDLGTPHQ